MKPEIHQNEGQPLLGAVFDFGYKHPHPSWIPGFQLLNFVRPRNRCGHRSVYLARNADATAFDANPRLRGGLLVAAASISFWHRRMETTLLSAFIPAAAPIRSAD